MSDMNDMLVEPFRRLIADIATPESLRAVEAGGDTKAIWEEVERSGFVDALVPEDKGGAGLALPDIFPLVTATGEFALPVPFAETVAARALLAARGAQAPEGAAIVFAPSPGLVPLATAASHALVPRGDQLALIPVVVTGADPFGAGGGTIDRDCEALLTVDAGGVDLSLFAAGLAAAKMAGAMVRILEMSLTYVGERQQFGRPLSKFQAIQHQMAVMAELVIAVQVAARIGMSGAHFDRLRVATAKYRASEASHQVCAIAHAVHGAIGVTEEYDLQVHTRRVKQWQLAFGTESHWAGIIGQERLRQREGTSADFIRHHLQDGELQP